MKILFNADAVLNTGFARATHHILDVLHKIHKVDVLGINYFGDPHKYPYPIWPANPSQRGDSWGLNRVGELLPIVRPDVLVLQNDPWNVAEYVKKYARLLPVIAFMPVDGKNCQGWKLNGLAMAIFYTQFAMDEARKGGYEGPACVIGLGVDREIYRPIPRDEARDHVLGGKLPPDVFVVGNVNRNQPRKRMDLSIAYFAEWIKTRKVNDAYLYLHVAPTGDKGWDVKQLANYYGVASRLITPKVRPDGIGVSEAFLNSVYNSFHVQINTGVGEGFGLTALEGMSAGIMQIAGDWSGLGDWARDAAYLVPCTTVSTMWMDINTIGGIPDRELFIEALDRAYRDQAFREDHSARGLALADQPQYRWSWVGKAFDAALKLAVDETESWEHGVRNKEPVA